MKPPKQLIVGMLVGAVLVALAVGALATTWPAWVEVPLLILGALGLLPLLSGLVALLQLRRFDTVLASADMSDLFGGETTARLVVDWPAELDDADEERLEEIIDGVGADEHGYGLGWSARSRRLTIELKTPARKAPRTVERLRAALEAKGFTVRDVEMLD